MSLTPGSTLGAYEILSMIGAGGMGEVYRARDAKLGREVAIKVLPASQSQDPVARERLRREAVAAAGLDHPFICKVFEIGEWDGHLFIVMELVVGETLHARLSLGAVPLSEALAWATEIAEALETAHGRQIVHRDLKPANVMVASQGHIKVMDFGLAKNVSLDNSGVTRTLPSGVTGPLTDHGARVGTPGYMAPEQIVGDAIDGRTDIFALGVLLCEAVSGAHPFRRATVAETVSAILTAAPLIASRPSADVPSAVRQILQRMLAKSPAERYQSMADVRRELVGVSTANPSGWSHLGGGRWASADRIGQARRWPMVGREPERADLMAKLESAMAGQGSLVLLGGEPGIGKTRLTEAVQDEARARGCMSLVGHAYEMEGSPPYVPFIEMLEYSARVMPPAALKHALGDAAPEVAKLMPELRQMFPDLPPALDVPPQQQRRMLFNGYRDFVERSCQMAPIVAVLEDLHWADDSTLQLLLHLAPAMASWPILVIATYRDVELEVTRPFAKVLESLLRQRLATRMSLRRLPAESVSALLAAMGGGLPAPPSLARIVFHETEGNPFFVEEVFQHLKEEGRLFDAAGQWRTDLRVETLDVPEGVRLVIGRRLERLGEQSRRVLTTAAVIGRSFSLSLLELLEGTDREDDVLVAVEEAEKAHLVAAQRTGREMRYLFTHELIRQTLADALSMPRRQRLHGRIAGAIERVYATSLDKHAPAMAHHLYQAGAASDPDKATQYLVAASDIARAASAPEESLRCLDQALSLWDDERGGRVADLHDRRGRVLRALGRPDDAIKALTCAVESWTPLRDVGPLVQSTVELAMTYLWQGDSVPAARVIAEVLERLQHASPLQRFPLMQMNALVLAGAGRAGEALAALDAADAVRRAAGMPELDLVALATEPHVRWMTMDPHRAAALSREAIARFETAGLHWQAADITYVGMYSLYLLGRLPTRAELDVANARARRVGHTAAIGLNQILRAYVTMYDGDLAGAERLCREAMEHSRAVQNRWGFFAALFAGTVALWQGRVELCLRDIEEAERTEPCSYYLSLSQRMRFWALAQVAPADAEAMLPSLPLGQIDLDVPNPFGAWMNAAVLVPGLAAIGRRDEAASFARHAEALIEKGIVCPLWTGSSHVVAGIATGCAGEWDASEAHFRKSLETAASLPLRPEEAHARVWYADMLRRRDRPGDREHARVLCGEAESLAATMGAVLIERRARDVTHGL